MVLSTIYILKTDQKRKRLKYISEVYIQDSTGFPKELLQMWPDLPRNEKWLPGASDFSGWCRTVWVTTLSWKLLENTYLPLGLQERLRNKSILKSLVVSKQSPNDPMIGHAQLLWAQWTLCSLARSVWAPLTSKKPSSPWPKAPRMSSPQGSVLLGLSHVGLPCFAGIPQWSVTISQLLEQINSAILTSTSLEHSSTFHHKLKQEVLSSSAQE